MRAEELMVGDLLIVNKDGLCIKKGSVVRVRGIDANNKFENHIGCATCRPLDKEQFEGGIWCDYLDPIPLISEILEKNFKELIPGINLMYDLVGPYMVSDENGQWVFGLTTKEKRYPFVKIAFIHELQHALYLCGIEKEIVL